MFSRRSVLITAALGLTLLSPALAADTAHTPYTQQAFEAALKEGKPVLVQVHASWCPTCRTQSPIIDKLGTTEKFQNMTVLRVDFDSQKDVCEKFGVQTQSTLIVFKDGKEVGRSVGDTGADSIEALLGKAL